MAIANLRQISETLRKESKHQAATMVENRVMAIEAVRRNESMKHHYGTIFNQCVVLLVSYFASAVQDLFRGTVAYALACGIDVPVSREEVKLAWRDLAAADDTPHVFADLLVLQKDISFQDMQSIARAFMNYFGITVERDPHVNDIVLGQAARHVIVHAAGVVDPKMVKQLSSAQPRSLKASVTAGEHLAFTPEEVRQLAAAMSRYIDTLIKQLRDKFPTA